MRARAAISLVAVGTCAALLVLASCSDDPSAACEGAACGMSSEAGDAPALPSPEEGGATTDGGEAVDAGAQLALTLTPATVTMLPDASATVEVSVARGPGVVGPVDISVEGTGVAITATPLQIASGATSGAFTLNAQEVARGKRTLTVSGALGALRASAPLELFVGARPGELDPSFGLGGRVKVYVDATELVRDMVLAPDGKILIAVQTGTTGAIVRLLADGSLDPAFGLGGIARTPAHTASGVRIRPSDGKIVVAGTGPTVNGHSPIGVTRLMPNGAIDTTFGPPGVDSGVPGTVFTNIDPKLERGNALDLQADGKIVVAGQAFSFTPTSYRNCVLVRLEENGGVDTNFATGGVFRGDATCTNFTKVLAQSGSILTSGTRSVSAVSSTAVFRFTAGGAPDPNFGTSGYATIGTGSITNGLAVLPTGEILAGSPGASLTLVRFLSGGGPDTAFAPDGGVLVTPVAGTIADVAVQANGKLAVAGSLDVGGSVFDFVAMRTDDAGAPDTTFNGTGWRTTDFGGANDSARSVAVAANGAIVVAGTSGGRTAVARYLP